MEWKSRDVRYNTGFTIAAYSTVVANGGWWLVDAAEASAAVNC